MQQSRPKLYYFNLYARGQPIRMLLSYLNIDYEEVTIDPPFFSKELKNKWDEIKNTFQFKTLPVFQIDGYKLSQSRSILRYLAVKYKLNPLSPYDIWRNQSLIDHYADIQISVIKAFFSQNQQAAYQDFVKSKLLHSFKVLERRLAQNQSQEYLVGLKMTVADVVWINFFCSIWMNPVYSGQRLEAAQSRLKKYPLLFEYVQKRRLDFPRLKTRKTSPI